MRKKGKMSSVLGVQFAFRLIWKPRSLLDVLWHPVPAGVSASSQSLFCMYTFAHIHTGKHTHTHTHTYTLTHSHTHTLTHTHIHTLTHSHSRTLRSCHHVRPLCLSYSSSLAAQVQYDSVWVVDMWLGVT